MQDTKSPPPTITVNEINDPDFQKQLEFEKTCGLLSSNPGGPMYEFTGKDGKVYKSRYVLRAPHGFEILTFENDETTGAQIPVLTIIYHSGLVTREAPYRFPATFTMLAITEEIEYVERLHQLNDLGKKNMDDLVNGKYQFQEMIKKPQNLSKDGTMYS